MVYPLMTFLFAFTLGMADFTSKVTDYLDAQLNHTDEASAVFVRQLNLVNDAFYAAHIYDRAGNIRIEGFYVETDEGLVEHGLFTFYHSNGTIESTGKYDKGIKVGYWERYTVSGMRRPDRYYSPEAVEMLRTMRAK